MRPGATDIDRDQKRILELENGPRIRWRGPFLIEPYRDAGGVLCFRNLTDQKRLSTMNHRSSSTFSEVNLMDTYQNIRDGKYANTITWSHNGREVYGSYALLSELFTG